MRLFALVRRLRDEGVAIIYVSHRLKEIFDLCDRITILKDGALVSTDETSALTTDEQMLAAMAAEHESWLAAMFRGLGAANAVRDRAPQPTRGVHDCARPPHCRRRSRERPTICRW